MKKITRVSVVEDRDHIRLNLKAQINHTDDLFCTSVYSDGEAALKGLIEDHPDIVIMDIGLPKMNGIECMLRVKLKCPDIIFLMYTIYEEDEKVFDALKSGASGYILKEERAKGAIQAIRSFVKDGGGPMSPSIARKVIENFHKYSHQHHLTEQLSEKQFIILKKIAEGKLNKEIAGELSTSEAYIKTCLSRIYKKLQVHNRVEALNKYLKETK